MTLSERFSGGKTTDDKEDRFSGRVAGKVLPTDDPEVSRPIQVPVPTSGVEGKAPGYPP